MSREKRIKENFKNHKATVDQYAQLDCGRIDIEVLTWKKPDSSSYMVRYIIYGNTLCVYGDLGEAIYQWSQAITFEWLSSLDLSYFKGKCQASEVGRDFREWNNNKAIDTLKSFAKDEYFKWSDFEENGGKDSLYDVREWEEWLRENGTDVLGENFWEWAFEIGYTINTRCMYHFIGLQMAMEQLRKNETIVSKHI